MAALLDYLFATFTLVYFSLQSTEKSALATPRKAITWRACPHHINESHNQVPVQAMGMGIAVRSQGKNNSYRSS